MKDLCKWFKEIFRIEIKPIQNFRIGDAVYEHQDLVHLRSNGWKNPYTGNLHFTSVYADPLTTQYYGVHDMMITIELQNFTHAQAWLKADLQLRLSDKEIK